jgi:hypothetical protein
MYISIAPCLPAYRGQSRAANNTLAHRSATFNPFFNTMSFVNVVHIGMRASKRGLQLLGRIFERMGAVDAQPVIANRFSAAFARIG